MKGRGKTGVASRRVNFKNTDSLSNRFLAELRWDFISEPHPFVLSFCRPKRDKKPWYEIASSVAEVWLYIDGCCSPDEVIGSSSVVKSSLAQTKHEVQLS